MIVKEEVTILNPYLKIHPDDNVFVALKDLSSGTIVHNENTEIRLQQDIAAKHKFFITDLNEGDDVIMYGTLVGKAQSFIPMGSLMTTTNTKHAAGEYAYRGFKFRWQTPDTSKFLNRTFNGYKRNDGRVGTANYWLFIPMVFCENRNLDIIKEALHKELGYAVSDKYNAFTHELLNAYKNGEDIHKVDLSPSKMGKERFFKNVDGIKFL